MVETNEAVIGTIGGVKEMSSMTKLSPARLCTEDSSIEIVSFAVGVIEY